MDAIQKHIYDGKIDVEYGSALYVLTAIWSKISGYVLSDHIDFEQMLDQYLCTSEKTMVEAAYSLFSGSTSVNLADVCFLDEANFKVVMQAIGIRRDGCNIGEIV